MKLTADTVYPELVPLQVAAAAVGPDGRLTLPHLVRLFQEAAMRNTLRLGIASPHLIAADNLSWVLRRQRIQLATPLPRMGEPITIWTAPAGFARGLLTYRDFYLRDTEGSTLAAATSEWLLMDITSRRPRPIPERIAAIAPFVKALANPDLRWAGHSPILSPDAPAVSITTKVAYHHLDFNDHLTNPVFPELMLEPLGRDFLLAHTPTLADITFHQEARYDEAVTARAALADEEGTTYHHALYREEIKLADMMTEWRAH